MYASCYGRIGQDPRSIQTKSGKPMCVCSIAVELATRDGQAVTQWLGIVAFGGVADDLARHAKGDPIGVSGRVQHNSYTKNDGTKVEQLQIVADSIVSARTVRPGGRRRSSQVTPAPGDAPAGPVSESEQPKADFDDAIAF